MLYFNRCDLYKLRAQQLLEITLLCLIPCFFFQDATLTPMTVTVQSHATARHVAQSDVMWLVDIAFVAASLLGSFVHQGLIQVSIQMQGCADWILYSTREWQQTSVWIAKCKKEWKGCTLKKVCILWYTCTCVGKSIQQEVGKIQIADGWEAVNSKALYLSWSWAQQQEQLQCLIDVYMCKWHRYMEITSSLAFQWDLLFSISCAYAYLPIFLPSKLVVHDSLSS